jgi:carbon monoxide dehydrogenase subunit G
MSELFEVERLIAADPADVFALLCDPQGHVAIDASGMLQDAEGDRVTAVGDTFVVHMDRESLNDIVDYGQYDVIVTIEEFEQDRLITWSILGRVRPGMGHRYGYRLEPHDEGTRVTSIYDWSQVSQDWKDSGVFPVISETNMRGTLGILDRTVRRGYGQP